MININSMNNNNFKIIQSGQRGVSRQFRQKTSNRHKYRTLCSSSPISNTFKLKQMFCQIERHCYKDNILCLPEFENTNSHAFLVESRLLNIFRGLFTSLKYFLKKERLVLCDTTKDYFPRK